MSPVGILPLLGLYYQGYLSEGIAGDYSFLPHIWLFCGFVKKTLKFDHTFIYLMLFSVDMRRREKFLME